MPDRIRLQQRASAAASQSLDLSIRAHGADSAPGEHTAAFRGVNAAGVDELTGVRRALSHGVSSLGAGRGDHKDPSPGTGGVCGRTSDFPSDRGVLADRSSAERTEQIGACTCILVAIACALFDAPYWIGRALITWGWA
jgi:hypothetical protein